MKDYKIRIPCQAVSRLVQAKAFSEGYDWFSMYGDGRSVRYINKPHLYLKECELLPGEYDAGFSADPLPEISWQEYLYGEGWFFKLEDDEIFFQAKRNNKTYWIDEYGSVAEVSYYYYGPEYYKSWMQCNMHGNLLTIKQQDNNIKQELNYTIPWKVKYNNEAELDAIRVVFKSIGCELYEDLAYDAPYSFVCVSVFCDKLTQGTEHCDGRPEVDLLTAIQHLLTPIKSEEELENERKINELEETMKKAQLEMEKASKQLSELKGG